MPNTKRPFPFTLGADPEFNILVGSRKADASTVMKAILKSDYTEESMGYNIGGKANIGWDGCASTGEIRPKPSNKPGTIVDNIRAAFKAVSEKIGIFDYVTHSKKAPVGGHIHIAIDNELTDKPKELERIHRCMSAFYLPIMLGEDVANMNLRMGGHSYGAMRDYRAEGRGNNISTYEFRVPTAEWLTTPKIAESVLAYMGVVWQEVIKNPKKFQEKYSDIVWKTLPQGDAIQQLLLSNYSGPIVKIVNAIKKAIRTFEYYPDYKDEIEYIFRPKKVLADKEKAHFNVIEGWELQPKMPTKRSILNSKLCADKTDEINFDAFASTIIVPHNGDTNTEVFSTELKRRIINFGWKMKNTYFIYGLKKGVKDFLAFNKAGDIIYDGDQIKTKTDLQFAEDLMGRMSARFVYDRYAGTAKEKAELASNHIMIGVPYSMRVKLKFLPFLKFIYDIEKGKYQPYPIAVADLKDDTDFASNPNTKGEFAKVYAPVSKQEDIEVESSDDAYIRDRSNADVLRVAGQDEDGNPKTADLTAVAIDYHNGLSLTADQTDEIYRMLMQSYNNLLNQ